MSGLTVGVVGASARAAVGSLLRAGFGAWAVDLFADRDLVTIAPTCRCPLDRYPQALPGLCEAFPPGPVLYTGGLENAPAVVGELARQRPLWGNRPEVLARARSLTMLQTILARCGPFPALILPNGQVPTTGRWLRKPRGGSGGFGIRTADPGESPTPTHDIQEFIEGRSLSALFVSHGKATTLLGVTEQLIGERWLHTTDFRYCGNLGPVEASDELQSSLCQLACSIAAETGLRGVWGMDFILRDEQPFLVEVNPRYTSGIEVLELATLVPILTAHAACYTTMSGPTVDRRPTTRGIVGKAIYFAPHRIVFPQDGPWCGDVEGPFDSCRLPRFADIPVAGEPIETGSPVLTFFATSSTVEQCRAILKETAADLDRLFAEEHSP